MEEIESSVSAFCSAVSSESYILHSTKKILIIYRFSGKILSKFPLYIMKRQIHSHTERK